MPKLFCFKLLQDSEGNHQAGTGFGFVDTTRHDLKTTRSYTGGPGLWWLRRYHGKVYSEDTLVASVGPEFSCPVDAEIRARVDMMKGEATFFVNGQEVPHKARGITAAVRPCVLSYSSNRVQLELLH